MDGRCLKRVLIVGAGDAGAMIVREMRNNPSYGYRPIDSSTTIPPRSDIAFTA